MWNYLNPFEKTLISTACLLIVLALYSASLPYSHSIHHDVFMLRDEIPMDQAESNGPAQSSSAQWCVEPECLLAAAGIMQDMDKTVNPCDDFYAYSCGGWIKSHTIPQDKSSIGVFDTLSDQNKEVLRDILEGQFKPENNDQTDLANFNKIKAVYDACMNETQIESLKAAPILPVIKTVLDNIPLAIPLPQCYSGQPPDGKPVDYKTLSKTLGLMANIGLDSLVGPGVDVDAHDPNINVLYISSAGISLPSKEYYKETDLLAVYRTTISDTFRLTLGELSEQLWPGTPVPADMWDRMAEQVVQFEVTLANVSLTPGQLHDPVFTYNPMTFSELAQSAPNIDWTLMVQTWLEDFASVPEKAVIDSPAYMRALSNDILPTTPQPTVIAYLLWRSINSYIGFLHTTYQKPARRLNQKLSGVNADVLPPRWRVCQGVVNGAIGQGAGRYFVMRKFAGESKETAESMINALKDIFKQRLPQLDWLDEPTRIRAIEKVDKLAVKVGYSSQTLNLMDPKSIEKYYANFTSNSLDYLGNAIRSSRFGNNKAKFRLGKPVDKTLWHMTPQTVNAYYSPSSNEIVFPAGILQQPFFNGKLPEYLNFGGVGVVIGHELTHAFDNHGRLFDPTGKLTDWWTNSTASSFEQKSKCFISQYDNFTIKGPDNSDVHVNGNLTLGENLADNGGIRESYLTWKARFDSDPQQQAHNNRLLPGLDAFTREQLYFISFARVWCSSYKPEKLVQLVRTDPHSPTQHRVNGAVMNSPLFAETFKCPPGSPMNPGARCEIW
ncbi:uncharacterized protein VTP21DRAFT_10730 [Calcarisporiella thermophila]|uniref:uncharacterized protein n=1 Tax=Calcarisporiella thermophila TaxID=911321 RepID=UPI003743D4F1